MKYYIIAGEASGDLHGSNLIKELRLLDANADIRCWGGDKMQAAGGTLVKHYSQLAFMGFIEVIFNLRTILKNIAFCKKDIEAYKPDILVLIDYPGFNLRISEWAHTNNYKIAFYISPQVWAWKASRVKKMKQTIDKMLVILPFEKAYYKNIWNWDVVYVGHPLVKVIEEAKESEKSKVKSQNTIAILPGSRKQEILKKLPVMLEVTKKYPAYNFVIAKAPGLTDAFYAPLLQPYNNVSTVSNQTYSLLANATAAMVTSGTATLETALFGVPEVVCYKGNPISYSIAKRLIKIKFISLVNLIMGKEVVKELIQHNMNPVNLSAELNSLLHDENKKQQLKKDYAALKQLLTQGGDASANAAREIYKMM